METNVLEKLHRELYDIYVVFAKICEENNLKFFALGGTLLGAVVHKGFIPWDDDIDVGMPRDDYDKFVNIISKKLPEGYYLHHTVTDSNYWLSFGKVRKKGTVFLEEERKEIAEHNEMYIDVFPFDYADSPNSIRDKIYWRIITYINNYIYCKQTGNPVMSVTSVLLSYVLNLFSIKTLSNFRDGIMRRFGKPDSKFFVDIAGGRRLDNSYFEVKDIFPLKKVNFGAADIVVPANPDKYLLQLYTEKYKIIPPESERKTHNPLLIRFSDGEEISYER